MEKERDEIFGDLLQEFKEIFLTHYEPVTDSTNADCHFSTVEIYERLQNLLPGKTGKKRFKPADVAAWMHAAGFKFRDYGFLQFEWMLKSR